MLSIDLEKQNYIVIIVWKNLLFGWAVIPNLVWNHIAVRYLYYGGNVFAISMMSTVEKMNTVVV